MSDQTPSGGGPGGMSKMMMMGIGGVAAVIAAIAAIVLLTGGGTDDDDPIAVAVPVATTAADDGAGDEADGAGAGDDAGDAADEAEQADPTPTPQPTATPRPTATAAPTPTPTPEPFRCPVGFCVHIEEVEEVDGELVIEWTAHGFEPALNNFHAHFFYDIYEPNQAGTNAVQMGAASVGDWQLTADQPFRTAGSAVSVAGAPAGTTQICVVPADSGHGVTNPENVECVDLP